MPRHGSCAAQIGDYRIRWANVQQANGHSYHTVRMCIAERRTRVLGWGAWLSVIDAEWCRNEEAAKRQIENDRRLRRPLPDPMVVPR